jgi:hypothetical protein
LDPVHAAHPLPGSKDFKRADSVNQAIGMSVEKETELIQGSLNFMNYLMNIEPDLFRRSDGNTTATPLQI